MYVESHRKQDSVSFDLAKREKKKSRNTANNSEGLLLKPGKHLKKCMSLRSFNHQGLNS